MALSNARKFLPVVTGNTVGSHNQIFNDLTYRGLEKVEKIEDCDFTLAFCPVVSRLGTDIEAAMQNIPVGKPVILVVLHHTFDGDAVVPESSRLVTRSDILLTVDFLFFETRGLLRCNKNDISLQRICDKLKLTKSILPGPPDGGPPEQSSYAWLVLLVLGILVSIWSYVTGCVLLFLFSFGINFLAWIYVKDHVIRVLWFVWDVIKVPIEKITPQFIQNQIRARNRGLLD